MQFSTLFLAAAAATLASAVQLTNPSFELAAGQSFKITWLGAAGLVNLYLKNGPSTALTTVGVIGTGLSGTSFEWTPPATLDDSLYAFEITDSTNDPNYSVQFQISGATAVVSTVTASSTGTASLTGASTSGTSSLASGSTTGSSTESSTASSATSSISGNSTTTTLPASSSTSSGNTTTTARTSISSSASKTSSLTTTVSKTSSKTASGTSTSTSGPTSAPTSAGADIASPLAFAFLAVAAILTLN